MERPTEKLLPELIENAILMGQQEKSKLTHKTFDAPGFTSPKIRHLLNNLGQIPGNHYLEIGVHKGATFIATNFENELESSFAIDNWSEFAQDGDTKKEFLYHTGKLLNPSKFKFYEQDCFSLKKEQFPNLINFYLYDGCHSYESQYKSLEYFYPFLDDVFIFLVDDWNWPDPQKGTRQAIKDLKLNILYEKELNEGWWNGLFVSLLKK